MSESSSETTTAPPSPAPVRELGHARTDDAASIATWWQSLTAEKVPELRWPAMYGTYDDMANNAQVSSVLAAVMLPILGTGWRIDGTGCDPQITRHVANDLGLPIVGEGDPQTDDDLPIIERFTWGEHAPIALEEALRYGHSVWEQKAELGEDGLWHLVKLGWRSPRSIAKFNTDRDGGLRSVEQTPDAGTKAKGNLILGVNRVVVYARERRGDNWRGRSLLRPAYQPWLLNNRAVRVEMILAERAGAPLTVYTGAQGEENLDPGRRLATQVRAGREAGAAIPHGATLKQQGIEGQLPNLDTIKRYNDEQIARAVLAHFLNLGGAAGTGSYALGSSFQNFFILSLRSVADDMARVASRHIARDIVNWNWPGSRPPKVVFDEIGARQDSIVQAVATLVSAGVLKADEVLEQFIRTQLGLPPRDKNAPVVPVPTQEDQ